MKVTEGNLIPDLVLNTFYKQIEEAKCKGESYDHFLKSIKKLNAGKIPDNILQLIAKP